MNETHACVYEVESLFYIINLLTIISIHAMDDVGVAVLRAVRDNEAFALRCVRFLLDRQDPDEISEGTSLRRNGRGLSKPHAEMLADSVPEATAPSILSRIASEYAHSQLAEAVRSGVLQIPPTILYDGSSEPEDPFWSRPDKKRRRRREILSEDEEEDQEEEPEKQVVDLTEETFLDEYGVHLGGIVMPSRAFVSRVRGIVDDLVAHNESVRNFPARVRQRVNGSDGWRGTNVSSRMVDAALYQVMPSVDLFTASRKALVRIFWVSEQRWATAEVVRVRRRSDTTNVVELFFPDEETDGTVTGPDTLYAYSLVR